MLKEFIPAIIQGVSGLIQYAASRNAVRQQNIYNLPKNQVQRLREAGIPLTEAKYFDNIQKSVPDTSGIGQIGAAAAGILQGKKTIAETKNIQAITEKTAYDIMKVIADTAKTQAETNLTAEQIKKAILESNQISENTKKIIAETSKAWSDALISKVQSQLDIETVAWLLDPNQYGREATNNLTKKLGGEQAIQTAQITAADLANRLSKVQTEVQEALQKGGVQEVTAIQLLDKLILETKNMEQILGTNEAKTKMLTDIIEGIKSRKTGEDRQSYMEFINDLVMYLILGGGNIQNVNPK